MPPGSRQAWTTPAELPTCPHSPATDDEVHPTLNKGGPNATDLRRCAALLAASVQISGSGLNFVQVRHCAPSSILRGGLAARWIRAVQATNRFRHRWKLLARSPRLASVRRVIWSSM